MEKIKKCSKIGIWGFGVVGKAALRFFQHKGFNLEIFDDRPLSNSETTEIKHAGARVASKNDLLDFLQNNDKIIPSPGIDLRAYKNYKSKWLPELDIIQSDFHKPIIAITGTAGKTTVTHLLSEILKSTKLKIWTGGNIGTGMLGLLNEQNKIDLAILEVSSFQLEHCKTFAPTIAIWTNFSTNHLDRHGTMREYFKAKKNIFSHQTAEQHAIIPNSIFKNLKKIKSKAHIVSKNKKLLEILKTLQTLTFKENLLIISIVLDLLSYKFNLFLSTKLYIDVTVIRLPEHRLENLGTKNDVTFYNDSKSTTPSSTVAAVKKISDRPILLLLGGLSKGADRSQLIIDIKKDVKKIYAFGAEAETIHDACKKHSVHCETFTNLEDAVAQTFADSQKNDQILLSPAGSSFDLFKNYEHRGKCFKLLVEKF